LRRLLAGSLATAALGVSAFLVVGSVAAPTVVAGAHAASHDPAVVAEAHAAFKRLMSAHATKVNAGGGISPSATGGVARAANGTVTALPNLNWSGYADTSSTITPDDFTYVSGSWTIPAIQCPGYPYQNSGAYDANWVGIDGFSDETVEQLGTGAQCYEGVKYYYVWYEMYPAGTVEEGTTACIYDNIDCPQPGDRISASVSVTAGRGGVNNYTLQLTDDTRPQESFSTTSTCAAATCLDSSAEWVVERPAYIPAGLVQFVPLADYGQTSFSSGSLIANGQPSSINGFSGAVYDMSIVDDSISYYLDCPNQQAPPGVLLFNTTVPNANCPAEPPTPRGGFSVTWDTSF
jgi:Peptidase A4 family